MFQRLWAVIAVMRLWLSAYKPPKTIPRRTNTINLCKLKWTQAKIKDETVTAIHRGMNLVRDGIRNPLKMSCKSKWYSESYQGNWPTIHGAFSVLWNPNANGLYAALNYKNILQHPLLRLWQYRGTLVQTGEYHLLPYGCTDSEHKEVKAIGHLQNSTAFLNYHSGYSSIWICKKASIQSKLMW